jgi:hypothetical protein
MAETPLGSQARRECSGVPYVLLLLTMPGLYAVQWSFCRLMGVCRVQTVSTWIVAFLWAYLAIGLAVTYLTWKHRRGSLALVSIMWGMAIVGILASYFWHLNNNQLTQFRMLEAIAFFSFGFFICLKCLFRFNQHQGVSAMPPNNRWKGP